MSELQKVDFLVVGAGIAGVSAAAVLAATGSVVVLEQEAQPGYHATGRSAALFSQLYGSAAVRTLTHASRSFLFDPPAGFSPAPLVRSRSTLYFASQAEAHRLLPLADAAGVVRLSTAQAQALVPVFKPGPVAQAVLDTGSADIDVDALLQGFGRQLRVRGGRLALGEGVQAIEREGGGWTVTTRQARYSAPVLVNAAGAWADELALSAGVAPARLQLLRRTALLIDPPAGHDVTGWPAAIHAGERFYFKPEAGLLLLSPADETPSAACDAQPEELDVAIAVDRYEEATGLQVQRVRRRWAGLRVFSADRAPVVGFDPQAPGFFWLAGQGGYGLQTAPAMARMTAALACGRPLPPELEDAGVDPQAFSPRRFAV